MIVRSDRGSYSGFEVEIYRNATSLH